MKSSVRLPLRAGLRLLALAIALSGCVTVYQPLGGLQRPVVVDPRLPNFAATRIFVRCLMSEGFSAGDANQLCQRVSTLFSNQGAEVETTVPADERAQIVTFSTGQPDLVIDLRSRVLYDEESTLMGVLACMTCTLIPTFGEQSFAQEIVIKDARGAVLATHTLKSRFVNSFGCGVWSINWLLDVFFRPDDQELTGDGQKRDHSADFYGQLSQLAFNARVRARLLADAPAPGGK